MWYLCDCGEQNPTEFARICRQSLSARALEDAFVPTYDRMKRYQGQWHVEEGIAFPDYIFLETKNAEALLSDMEKCCQAGKLSRYVIQQMVSLQPEQEDFLRNVLGTEKHMGISRGYIKDGRTYVMRGPLKGKEKLICKIDRHKRLAKLKISVGDSCKEMQAGLEIISKN